MNKDYSEQEALAMVKTIIAEETDENPDSITQEMTLSRDLDMDANSIEQVSFLKVFFEVASAYSTCGLSMGLTPDLSIPGRIVICTVMFVGRMGPLFLISAVAKKQEQGMWYAEEDIMVG